MKKHALLKLSAALLLLLLLQGAYAWAGDPRISVGSLYDYLPGNSSSMTKPIRNSGDETGFLRIEMDKNGKSREIPQPE